MKAKVEYNTRIWNKLFVSEYSKILKYNRNETRDHLRKFAIYCVFSARSCQLPAKKCPEIKQTKSLCWRF